MKQTPFFDSFISFSGISTVVVVEPSIYSKILNHFSGATLPHQPYESLPDFYENIWVFHQNIGMGKILIFQDPPNNHLEEASWLTFQVFFSSSEKQVSMHIRQLSLITISPHLANDYPTTWSIIPGLGYVVNKHVDRKSPKDRVVGPLPHGRMGVALTTYDTWDDPPTNAGCLYCWYSWIQKKSHHEEKF